MKRRGFTLVELIAVISILSIIILMAAPNLLRLMGTNKEKSLKRIKDIVVSAGRNYAVDNNIEGPTNIPLSKLCNGYIDCPIKNPVTGENLNGRVRINEVNEFSYVDAPIKNCTFDGEMVQGAVYINGQYEYHYKQQYIGSSWGNMSIDGWGVALTDSARNSTDAINTEMCTTINNKYITSYSNLFADSRAIAIDLSSFNTSNVTYMGRMFYNSNVETLDLSGFDTSKLTSMWDMFYNCKATTITGLDSFDTSNVTNMVGAFNNTNATELDLSSFNTSKVTSMVTMFANSKVLSLDLRNFDTKNVTDMSNMFVSSALNFIDLSSFDTSKVENMGFMFAFASNLKQLNLSNFDTSNVKYMNLMFSGMQLNEIDLSSFNTSNVSNMYQMFSNSKFKSLDLSSFDTSNVTNTDDMFNGTTATIGYARTQTDANILNASTNKPAALIFRTKLPNEYQAVEYIQSSGTQHILTNIKVTNTSGAYLQFSSQDIATDLLYFGTKGSGDTRFWAGNINNTEYFGWNTSTATASRPAIALDTTYILKMNYLNDRKQDFNGTIVASNIGTLGSNTYPLAIFAGNSAGTINYKSSIKLYKLIITDGSSVVADFVPCFRKSDNEIGLYDVVSGTFYTNAGTGKFTKGKNI